MTALPATPDARLRLFLFLFLLGVYLLVYIPRPDSADGDAVLAVSASLIREGSPNINAVAYADWLLPLPASRMGAFGVDGALYAKKGVTPSLFLLPLVALSDALPWLTTRATAMLLNPLVTALTAALLYTLVRRLGYRPRVAVPVSLIYGLATFAIVYTKTLFGEPLAALLLLLAVLAALDYRATSRHRHLLIVGTSLGLMIGVNTVYALFVPIIAVFLFFSKPLSVYGAQGVSPLARLKSAKLTPREGLGRGQRTIRHALIVAAPVLITLILLGAYNGARFGSAFSSGYHFAEGEGFTRPIHTGLYGLFISPFRGIVWYNPVLILSVPGWWMLRRRSPRFAWLALILVAAQALVFAAWWSWHGGIVWGPRFLLPVLPLMAAFLAPVVDNAAARLSAPAYHRAALHVGLIALVVVSFAVQMLGVLYSYFPYINGYLNVCCWTGEFDAPLTALRDDVLTTPELSPIVGHAALASAGWQMEPAWLARGVDPVHLGASLVLIALAVVALKRRLTAVSGAVTALVAVLCLMLVVSRQHDTPDATAVRALSDALEPRGTVVAATTLYESTLLDLERTRVITMNAPTEPDDAWARSLWTYARQQDDSLWLVSWFGAGDAQNWQERDLWQTAAFVREVALDGHRALLFHLTAAPEPDTAGGWRFGAITLDSYGVAAQPDGIGVTLAWSAAALPENAQWFIHLLNANGDIVAQQDRPPQGGYALTSAWTPAAPVLDRLFFPLPPNTDTTGWQLRLGWIDTATGERLTTVDANGAPVPDDFILLPLRPSP